MKVILFEENKVKEVSDGYARNYLFPQKLAVPATEGNLKNFEKSRQKRESLLDKKRQAAQEISAKLEAEPLTIAAEAGEEGKLFGSITTADISQKIKETLELEIDRRKIILDRQIKTVGEFEVGIKVFHDIIAKVKVNILPK